MRGYKIELTVSKEKKKEYRDNYKQKDPEKVKELAKEASRRYYQTHKEKLQLKRTEFYRNHRSRQKLRGIKHRCKKFNLPFDVDADYMDKLEVPEFCPVLGIKLNPKDGKGPHSYSPSIDRIIPELGYIKGNLRIISNRANILKNNMTAEECEKILEDLKKCQNG